MRPLRYSINVTLDGCCDHEATPARARRVPGGASRRRRTGHGPTLCAGLSQHVDLRLVDRLELASGAVSMRYEPRR